MARKSTWRLFAGRSSGRSRSLEMTYLLRVLRVSSLTVRGLDRRERDCAREAYVNTPSDARTAIESHGRLICRCHRLQRTIRLETVLSPRGQTKKVPSLPGTNGAVLVFASKMTIPLVNGYTLRALRIRTEDETQGLGETARSAMTEEVRERLATVSSEEKRRFIRTKLVSCRNTWATLETKSAESSVYEVTMMFRSLDVAYRSKIRALEVRIHLQSSPRAYAPPLHCESVGSVTIFKTGILRRRSERSIFTTDPLY